MKSAAASLLTTPQVDVKADELAVAANALIETKLGGPADFPTVVADLAAPGGVETAFTKARELLGADYL